jgi:nucleoside-diphosphate-sugar epimerase
MVDKTRTALIFGISGIVGRNLAEHLLNKGGWNVVGVSRTPLNGVSGLKSVTCDLNQPDGVRRALESAADATHMFFCTWNRRPTEHENCVVNGGMLKAALEGATANAKIRHAALVTGLKHYLGSFENYLSHTLDTPFSEEQERLPGENFYYTQEDILFDFSTRYGFTWSVARPHTIIGYAPGNAMNLGTSIAVYATICRETGLPFVFPGSVQAYEGLVDMTDARILAHHLEWEATSPVAENRAFNVVNGDYFRWKKMWGRIAQHFGIDAAPYPGTATPLVTYLAGRDDDWRRICKKHDLKFDVLSEIAPWWHVDADLGRTQECITDMSRSREAGFLEYCNTWRSFKQLFERLQSESLIPEIH